MVVNYLTYIQYLTRVAMAMAMVLFIPAILVFYVDPFQIFHKSYLSGMGLINNQRFQNAGLINTYLSDPDAGYDSVMIGSSVSTNFSSESAASALGWKKPLRLFIDGGDPSQLALILSHALSTHRVHHVLWEIPPRGYSPPRYFPPLNDQGFPDYLYNNNILDNLRYIFNYAMVKSSWLYLTKNNERPAFTPDTIGYWSNSPQERLAHQKFNSAENLQEQRSTYQNQAIISEQEKTMDVTQFRYPVIDQIVSPILSQWCNTDVEFVLFIPPISKIDYLANPKYVLRSIYMVDTLVKKIENCRNIRLHAFDTMSFTGDLNNYVDKMHYRLHISNKILALIGSHQHIINVESFEKYKRDFILGMDNYQVYSTYPAIPEP